MQRLEPRVPLQELRDPLVVVLIDDDETEIPVRLCFERTDERGKISGSVDGRHDEIELRSGVRRLHRRRLPSAAVAAPLVSAILAARDAEGTIDEAVRSVLRQAIDDLELLVVDDGSVDRTGERLAAIHDSRLRVLRNEIPLGLGGALNVGLDAARGSYVARMDADDVALPGWLPRILAAIRSRPGLGVVGTGMIELHADGSLGALHRMPVGRRAVRWAALFSTPFYHSTVILDRTVLDEHGLRYDTAFDESEDFELWTRLLSVIDGDNIPDAMVLYRQHPGQASRRRRELQLEFGRRIGLREITHMAPELSSDDAELAWLAGSGWPVPEGCARAGGGCPFPARARRSRSATAATRHGRRRRGRSCDRRRRTHLSAWLSRVRRFDSIPCSR